MNPDIIFVATGATGGRVIFFGYYVIFSANSANHEKFTQPHTYCKVLTHIAEASVPLLRKVRKYWLNLHILCKSLCISEHLHCFVANSFVSRFFCVNFQVPKSRSRNFFDKYDVCLNHVLWIMDSYL